MPGAASSYRFERQGVAFARGDRTRIRSQQGRHLRAIQPGAPERSDARGQTRTSADDRAERPGDFLRNRVQRARRPGARAQAGFTGQAVPLRSPGRRAGYDDQADRFLPGLIRPATSSFLEQRLARFEPLFVTDRSHQSSPTFHVSISRDSTPTVGAQVDIGMSKSSGRGGGPVR